MSLETDLLLDRRRLKRSITLWRCLAVAAVLVAIVVGLARINVLPEGRHVARLSVDGLITDDRKLTEAIDKLADDSNVAALIVAVDSPGGSVAGGESIHDAVARVAAKKPVVTVMAGTAASAGYMISVPAARIFARESTLTGSIGVLLETGEVSGLLGKLGITSDTIVSGPLKDQPGLTHPTSPAGREVMQGIVMDLYDQFVQIVATGRHMDVAAVRKLADGRAYTGRQALGLGLIDQIGDETTARAWLAAEKQVPVGLPARDVRPAETLRDRLLGATGSLGDLVLAELVGKMVGGISDSIARPAVRLDGAWAVWQR
jgi:protease-4